jgi:hypothetical protein
MGTRFNSTANEQQGNLWTVSTSSSQLSNRFPFSSSITYRYIDDIFMTTNETDDRIESVLLKARNKDKNIEIESTMGSSANYLDVTIINDNGRLTTKIYHKPTAEPYFLPYTSDHPHRYHRNIPYSALVRAARLCSSADDFKQERLRLDLSLLLSNYPPKMISNQFQRFFQVNQADLLLRQPNERTYEQLHHMLLNRTTTKTELLRTSIADLVESPSVLLTKPWDKSIMYPRFTFESGPQAHLASEFFSWWRKHYQYQHSPVKNIKIRLISQNRQSLANFFIHKKPSRTKLTRMEQTDK